MKLFITSLMINLAIVSCEKARFDYYRVYKIYIENEKQLEAMKLLADSSDSYDFWQHPSHVDKYTEIMVPPHKFAEFEEITRSYYLSNALLTNNLQTLFDEDEKRMKRRKNADEMDWTEYHNVDTIYKWLDSLQAEFPNFVNVTTIGSSYEGRPMKLVKLSKKPGNRAIFVESHIHAREWIASATSTWILNQLLRSTRDDVKNLANNTDWYFLPITNPDGLEYTRNSNRMWRKTRSKHSPLCFGVDANRNFAHTWMVPNEEGMTGSSTSPCTDHFSGPYPFSEPECAAIDRVLNSNKGAFDAYIALHSYDHSVLYPYGNSKSPATNIQELHQVGEAAIHKLESKHGIKYRVGMWSKMLYASSGTSQDHAHGHHKIPIAYTVEMRGVDLGGFILPPEYIIPNSEEILEFFIGLVEKAREFGRFSDDN